MLGHIVSTVGRFIFWTSAITAVVGSAHQRSSETQGDEIESHDASSLEQFWINAYGISLPENAPELDQTALDLQSNEAAYSDEVDKVTRYLNLLWFRFNNRIEMGKQKDMLFSLLEQVEHIETFLAMHKHYRANTAYQMWLDDQHAGLQQQINGYLFTLCQAFSKDVPVECPEGYRAFADERVNEWIYRALVEIYKSTMVSLEQCGTYYYELIDVVPPACHAQLAMHYASRLYEHGKLERALQVIQDALATQYAMYPSSEVSSDVESDLIELHRKQALIADKLNQPDVALQAILDAFYVYDPTYVSKATALEAPSMPLVDQFLLCALDPRFDRFRESNKAFETFVQTFCESNRYIDLREDYYHNEAIFYRYTHSEAFEWAKKRMAVCEPFADFAKAQGKARYDEEGNAFYRILSQLPWSIPLASLLVYGRAFLRQRYQRYRAQQQAPVVQLLVPGA